MDKRLKSTIPLDEIEDNALEQINQALQLPCLKKLAIMPDVHAGYDLPIGGVALLDDHIWPGAVGYDIGCGMCHIDTREPLSSFPDMQVIYKRITNMIPIGFSERKTPHKPKKFPNGTKYAAVADAIYHKASLQLGTLGGGNHFIEIGVNSNNNVGITIHSGSRRPGWLLGDLYMKITQGPIHIDTDIAKAYVKDMSWALYFALENRTTMMSQCLEALGLDDSYFSYMINENHNHAEITDDGVLHRKGATPAEKGQLGVIPANMRDGVWITRGLGNQEYLASASHGAGRTMSRNKAKKTILANDFKEQMGSIISPDLNNLLDEAPEAYKDIHGVIKAQDGILVDIIDHFRPLIVIKG